MNEFLVRHAIQNVWCSPDQDHQYLFQPTRLTPDGGVERYVNVEWDRHWLPDQQSTFHVYQLGQISPLVLNLIPQECCWYSFSIAMNTNNILLDAYTREGRQLPRFEAFFLKTRTRNLIVAIIDNERIADLNKEKLYVRFYSNAYFGTEETHPTSDRIHTEGIVAGNRQSVVRFKQTVERVKHEWSGNVYEFHNGWLVDTLRPDDVKPGDKIEYVHDSSIYEIYDVRVRDLETFVSELDNKRKYLISRPKGSTDTIDFHDDIDIWIIERNGGRERGLFYHKGAPDAVRMVTHKDLSIPVPTLVGQVQLVEEWPNPRALTLRLRIRKSGYHRPLVYEHNRINDLYHLDTGDQIDRALVGANSNLTEWQASHLENSCYTAIMRAKNLIINKEMVQCAYGYHAISHLIANTPQSPVTLPSGKKGVTPPWRLRFDATFFEYDMKGRLIDWVYMEQAPTYTCRHAHTGYLEAFPGKGSLNTKTEYNRYSTPLNWDNNYWAYICDVVAGEPTFDFRLATPHEEYTTTDNRLVWLTEKDDYFTAVRQEPAFLVYGFNATPHNGMLRFEVESEDLVGELTRRIPCSLPFGQLDIFLNGHSLIENLDYFVKWPEVVICNKEHLITDGSEQHVVVRAYGFLDDNGNRFPPADYGFVQHGLLSVNGRYDVREGKVMRFVADGRLHDRRELKFAENDWGVRTEGVRNGAPYAITDTVVPMHKNDVIGMSPAEFRQRSLDMDQKVSDYMSYYKPEPDAPNVDLIPRRYRILSPFVSRIHHDLRSGYLYPTEITGQYSDEKIKEWLAQYEWLLDFDPVVRGVDERYVNVHPHELFTVTELDIYQYNFLNRVIRVYMQDRINLSTHVKVKEGWV